jgi:hypothetical protein
VAALWPLARRQGRMLSWDAKAIEEEGRRQRMRDDFELSGDDESVVSDDAGEMGSALLSLRRKPPCPERR